MKKNYALLPFLVICILHFSIAYSQCTPYFTKIDAGRGHTLAIRSDGTLWAWGHLYSSELINPSTDIKTIPTQIGTANNWIQVDAGSSNSTGITSDGLLWVWGRTGFSDISSDPTIPTAVATDKQWKAVSTGDDQSVIGITTDGKLWKFQGSSIPQQIGIESDWAFVQVGAYNNFAIKTNGELWAWGTNRNGELGDGTKISKSLPVQISIDKQWLTVQSGDEHSIGITTDGKLWAWGSNRYGQLGTATNVSSTLPIQIGTGNNWEKVSAGDYHSLAITQDQKCWAWGNNEKGQLGNGTLANTNTPTQFGTTKDWMFVSAGWQRSVAMKTDQSTWACGLNDLIPPRGILGDGTNIDKQKPVRIDLTTLANQNTATTNYQTGVTFYSSACSLLASIESRGDNPVSGNINVKVFVDESQPKNYVKRHYEITPENYASNATGRVSLYFTQDEFNEFNEFNNINPVKLPTGSNDAVGIANILIEKRSGISSDGSGSPQTYSGSVTINPNDAKVIWNLGANRWEISFDVTDFSGFFLKTQATPLPVSWKSISATIDEENRTKVMWEVIETNVKEYQLQQSINAVSFNQIANIISKGNGHHFYSYTDLDPLAETTYYRVKQIDIDGTETLSRIVSISAKDKQRIIAYPIPASDKVTLNIPNQLKKIESATIFDKQGRPIRKISLKKGKNEIDITNLESGLYLIKTTFDQVIKLVKE